MKMRYFLRPWGECRGDEYAAWGRSLWFFEVDELGNVLRQIEAYENGPVLKYDEANPEDVYGGLSEKALDLEDFEDFEIPGDKFEFQWELPPDQGAEAGDADRG